MISRNNLTKLLLLLIIVLILLGHQVFKSLNIISSGQTWVYMSDEEYKNLDNWFALPHSIQSVETSHKMIPTQRQIDFMPVEKIISRAHNIPNMALKLINGIYCTGKTHQQLHLCLPPAEAQRIDPLPIVDPNFIEPGLPAAIFICLITFFNAYFFARTTTK